MSKYLFISAQAGTWTVSDQWRASEPPPVPAWQPAAQQALTRHAGRYGTRRLRAESRQVGRYALRSWLRVSG